MNSLYGRFGINPRSTITEICGEAQYNELLMLNGFQSAHPLGNNQWLCSYLFYDTQTEELYKFPRKAAVQISAAITAHARIHMYPYISR